MKARNTIRAKSESKRNEKYFDDDNSYQNWIKYVLSRVRHILQAHVKSFYFCEELYTELNKKKK